MTRYGWYYDGGTLQDESDDVWDLIGRAVPEAAMDGRLHALKVGALRDRSVDDLFDEDDVEELAEDGRLTADAIITLVDERHGEQVYEGQASLRPGSAEALNTAIGLGGAAVVAWAVEHIDLDPPRCCLGRPPLPIEYVEGEWEYGGPDVDQQQTATLLCEMMLDDDEEPPAAAITYATEPRPSWIWWTPERMGEAPTLKEAMARADEALAKETP